MLELFHTVAEEDRCPYLHDRNWRMEYRGILQLSPDEYEELLARGWRRNGSYFFRPQCSNCAECRSLRVDVDGFTPSKSQRKCLKRNADVELVVRPPTVSEDHIRLFKAYHDDMTERRGWPIHEMDEETYYTGFISRDYEFAREFVYLRDSIIIGIGLVDVVPGATSSVYFFHDPAWRTDGPGTFSILKEIEFAQQTNRPHVYLGYCVDDCPSMSYKARFGPHRFLQGFVKDHQSPVWGKDEG